MTDEAKMEERPSDDLQLLRGKIPHNGGFDEHIQGHLTNCPGCIAFRSANTIESLQAEVERLKKSNEHWHERMSFVVDDERAFAARIAELEADLQIKQDSHQIDYVAFTKHVAELEAEVERLKTRLDSSGDYSIQLQKLIEDFSHGRELRFPDLHHHKMLKKYLEGLRARP